MPFQPFLISLLFGDFKDLQTERGKRNRREPLTFWGLAKGAEWIALENLCP